MKHHWRIFIIILRRTNDMLCYCGDDLPRDCNLENTTKYSLPHNVSVQSTVQSLDEKGRSEVKLQEVARDRQHSSI